MTQRFRLADLKQSKWLPFAIAVLFGAIGVYLIFRSNAATPTASTETESGAVTSPATKVTDATASGGSAIKFGGAVTTGGFVHPGIFMDKTQLDLAKTKIAAGVEPWKTGAAWIKLASDPTTDGKYTSRDGYAQMYNSLNYTPHPANNFQCTTLNANGKSVCTTLINDSNAALAHALMYVYALDGNSDAHAQKAIQILNAWANTWTTATAENQLKLETSWATQAFTKAAEIMRHTYTPPAGKTALNVTNVSNMLTNVVAPLMANSSAAFKSSNGNWRLTMLNAKMNIGVFTDNRAMYNEAVADWKLAVPAYIYMTSDGPLPKAPAGGLYDTSTKLTCYWAGAGTTSTTCSPTTNPPSVDTTKMTFVSGMTQETCRDPDHVSLGMGGLFAAAETARIQGDNLYQLEKARLLAGLNFTLKYNAGHLNGYGGVTVGSYSTVPCGGDPINAQGGTSDDSWNSSWETAYATLHHRMGETVDPAVLYYLQTNARSTATRNIRVGAMTGWEAATSPVQ